jgi:hypothetical protein
LDGERFTALRRITQPTLVVNGVLFVAQAKLFLTLGVISPARPDPVPSRRLWPPAAELEGVVR